eukprot:7719971-Alexandrium_andersonii.AAC.1
MTAKPRWSLRKAAPRDDYRCPANIRLPANSIRARPYNSGAAAPRMMAITARSPTEGTHRD